MQPTVTAADAIVQASEEMCQILKGLLPVKGDTNTAVELLIESFEDVRAGEESKTNAQRKRSADAVDKRKKSDEAELELKGIWTAPNNIGLADDNLRTEESAQITHPSNHLLHRKTNILMGKKRLIRREEKVKKGGQTSLKTIICQQG